jgi:bifunctional DNA-binding transcriptional regulator/antitoxin component of YhaV-PrlF toxin-antitoxin module
MILTMDAKRRLTIPVSVASAQPGDAFELAIDAEEDAIVFRRINRNIDWLAILEECPVSMDDPPPRRREYFQSKL